MFVIGACRTAKLCARKLRTKGFDNFKRLRNSPQYFYTAIFFVLKNLPNGMHFTLDFANISIKKEAFIVLCKIKYDGTANLYRTYSNKSLSISSCFFVQHSLRKPFPTHTVHYFRYRWFPLIKSKPSVCELSYQPNAYIQRHINTHNMHVRCYLRTITVYSLIFRMWNTLCVNHRVCKYVSPTQESFR